MAEDWHAISGYTSILNGRAVSWSAKRQEIVSLLTTESEYVAVTHAAKEALWLRSLLSQIFDNVANEVETDVNMLGASMILMVFCQCDG